MHTAFIQISYTHILMAGTRRKGIWEPMQFMRCPDHGQPARDAVTTNAIDKSNNHLPSLPLIFSALSNE